MADIVLQHVNLSRDQMTVLSHYSPHIVLHTVFQHVIVNLSRDQMTVLSHYSPHIVLHTALNLIRIMCLYTL